MATAFELVSNPGPLRAMLLACTTLTGNAGRGDFKVMADSNGKIVPCNVDGSAQELSGGLPGGILDGLVIGFARRGVNIFGLGCSNQCSGRYNIYDSTGLYSGYEDFPVTPVGTFAEADSYPFNTQDFPGHLALIDAAGGPPSTANGSTIQQLAAQDDPLGNGCRWKNQFYIGNPSSVDLVCSFSYKTPDAAAIDLWVGCAISGFGNIASKHITTGTSGAWVDDSFTIPATVTGNDRWIQLFHYGVHKSTGPVAISGIRITRALIDPKVSTSGPGGIAFTLGYTKIGDTSALCLSAIKASRTGHTEFNRASTRSCDWRGIYWGFAGNDAASSANSFKYTDSAGSPTGPANNTAAGWVQNIKTAIAFELEDWIARGGARSKFVFVVGGYHGRTTSPSNTVHPIYEDAIAAEIAAGTLNFDRVVLIRGSKVVAPQTILELDWYNANPLTITGISATNPAQVTTNNIHSMATGDRVRIISTNSTPKLDSPTSPGSYYATVLTTLVFSVPVNVTGSGSAGYVANWVDQSHGRSALYEGFYGLAISDALFTAAGLGASTGGTNGCLAFGLL